MLRYSGLPSGVGDSSPADDPGPGGSTLTPERQQAPISSCWECEQELDAPHTVTIRVNRRDVSTITLCPTCYWTIYRPLARDESGVLDGSLGQSTSVRHHPH
jgi:hypothetical protein